MYTNLVFFDDSSWDHLLPLTFTRPVCELRTGILKIREKWERMLGVTSSSYLTRDYLQEKYPLIVQGEKLVINGSVLPDQQLIEKIVSLNKGDVMVDDAGVVIAWAAGDQDVSGFLPDQIASQKQVAYPGACKKITYPDELFTQNGSAIASDFSLLTAGRSSEKISSSNHVVGSGDVFLEPGARMECAVINTEGGPVYIGRDAEVMEGCLIRGPFALCDHAVLKMGAKIYGATTIGPHSKVGGEVNNSVVLGFSNKAHDGFLGNSVIGEWCNLGADSNNSNLKNNYAEVKLWSYVDGRFRNTGLQFCGLIMGDHSKCGINTMFNTGTVVGVSVNIFGAGFPRNFIPSFSWGGGHGYTIFSLPKAFEVAQRVMERRGIHFDVKEQRIFEVIFERTNKFRKY